MDRVALRISHAYSESYSIMEFWNGGLAWIFRLVFQTVFWMNGSVDTICWWFPHAQCRLNYIVGFISEKNQKNDTPILVPKKLSLGFQSTIFSQLWLICPKIMKATWLRMLSFFGKAHLSTVCVSCDFTGDNNATPECDNVRTSGSWIWKNLIIKETCIFFSRSALIPALTAASTAQIVRRMTSKISQAKNVDLSMSMCKAILVRLFFTNNLCHENPWQVTFWADLWHVFFLFANVKEPCRADQYELVQWICQSANWRCPFVCVVTPVSRSFFSLIGERFWLQNHAVEFWHRLLASFVHYEHNKFSWAHTGA